ncbi:hypothetical protein [Streptomyces cucumeris]|uniref:hypothetical protein n=1 Tax=Streptomyces cucumeris TaxID=2962890 RepID=UPI003D72F759
MVAEVPDDYPTEKEIAELKRANGIRKAGLGLFRGRTRPATHALVVFIEEIAVLLRLHRAGSTRHQHRPSTYYAARKSQLARSPGTVRDEELKEVK